MSRKKAAPPEQSEPRSLRPRKKVNKPADPPLRPPRKAPSHTKKAAAPEIDEESPVPPRSKRTKRTTVGEVDKTPTDDGGEHPVVAPLKQGAKKNDGKTAVTGVQKTKQPRKKVVAEASAVEEDMESDVEPTQVNDTTHVMAPPATSVRSANHANDVPTVIVTRDTHELTAQHDDDNCLADAAEESDVDMDDEEHGHDVTTKAKAKTRQTSDDDEVHVENEHPHGVSDEELIKSEPSGSDYGETRDHQDFLHETQLRPHPSDIDMEEEDDNFDVELAGDVVSDAAVSRHQRHGHDSQSKHRSSAQEEKVVEHSDSEDNAASNHWTKVSGPLLRDARQTIIKFGEAVMSMATDLAREFGKSTHDILVQAGLSFKPSCAANPANKFHQHYSRKYPKAKDVSTTDYLKKINIVYKELYKGIESDDEEAREAMTKSILEMCDTVDVEDDTSHGQESAKSITARMLSAKDQFTSLAAAYRNLADMEVVGAILYTGTDASGRQTSAIFGGSPAVKKLIEQNQVDVRKFIDFLTTSVKSSHFSLEGFNLPTRFGHGVEVEAKDRENPRDHYRRVLTGMMLGTLQQYDESITRIHWMNWLNIALQHKLHIVDWPAGIAAPGPNFNYKQLKTNELKSLTVGFIENRLHGYTHHKIPRIVEWTEEHVKMSEMDPLKGLIPLVQDDQGSNVRLLCDAKDWAKSLQHSAAETSSDSSSESSGPSSESQVMPQPPMLKASRLKQVPPRVLPATTIDTVPHKRRRQLDADEESDQSDKDWEVALPVIKKALRTAHHPSPHAPTPHSRDWPTPRNAHATDDQVVARVQGRAVSLTRAPAPPPHADNRPPLVNNRSQHELGNNRRARRPLSRSHRQDLGRPSRYFDRDFSMQDDDRPHHAYQAHDAHLWGGTEMRRRSQWIAGDAILEDEFHDDDIPEFLQHDSRVVRHAARPSNAVAGPSRQYNHDHHRRRGPSPITEEHLYQDEYMSPERFDTYST